MPCATGREMKYEDHFVDRNAYVGCFIHQAPGIYEDDDVDLELSVWTIDDILIDMENNMIDDSIMIHMPSYVQAISTLAGRTASEILATQQPIKMMHFIFGITAINADIAKEFIDLGCSDLDRIRTITAFVHRIRNFVERLCEWMEDWAEMDPLDLDVLIEEARHFPTQDEILDQIPPPLEVTSNRKFQNLKFICGSDRWCRYF
ncbi:hypothetical protein F4808DRAFT_414789 [Astrocystis sublimbata]|nr:hypothetical protein F4808DRAFT_414789 [Astrocystis sublimbata]